MDQDYGSCYGSRTFRKAMAGPLEILTSKGALSLVLLMLYCSCNILETRARIPLSVDAGSIEGDLTVAARFACEDDDVPGFFRTALADSGILALQVVMKNLGSRAILVHCSNGMSLGPGFAGVRLVCGSDTLEPVSPHYACSALLGYGRTARYRKPAIIEAASSPLVPPYAVYVLYKEVTVGKFYRPLVAKSFFSTFPSGQMAAATLEPGEERRGWLYFDSTRQLDTRSCKLIVSACLLPDAFRSIAGYDFAFPRNDSPPGFSHFSGETSEEGSRSNCLLSLIREGKESVLCCTTIDDLLGKEMPNVVRIAELASREASIADASYRGDRVAIGLNFKAKSRILTFECARPFSLANNLAIPRTIKRVFVLEDGVCALTSNGFGYLLGYSGAGGSFRYKLAREFEDADIRGDTLIVFDRQRGRLLFDINSPGGFSLMEGGDRRGGARQVIGNSGDVLAMICTGRSLAGDTLVYCDVRTNREVRRMELNGRVVAASLSGLSTVLQLEDGTLLRISPRPLGMLGIDEAGWLPFKTRALLALPRGFIGVSSDGRLASGTVSSLRPGAIGALEASAVVRHKQGDK